MNEVTIASRLAATSEVLWEHLSSLEGVNRELWPVCRMTYPRWAPRFTPETVAPGKTMFRSWMLLFGFLPFDYDDLCLVRLDPGRGLLERSSLASQKVWEHERTLTPCEGGCELRDRLRFEPRLAWLAAPSRLIVRLLFAHRHRRLRVIFGELRGGIS